MTSDSRTNTEDIDTFLPEKDRITALLIDDDVEDSFLFSRLVARSKQIHFDIVTCRTVENASELMRKARFDVVYIDYWLGMDTSIGFIHSESHQAAPPLILITGLDTPDIRRCAYRAGAVGFLAKDALSVQAIESVTLAVLNQDRNH